MGKLLEERYPDLPGTDQLPPPRRERFEELRKRRGEGYQPRTRHLRPDGSARYTNRLFLESSPYLLQHAHNPVNWFPWGEEAFQLAKRLDRPVLVSIGYATCHWCHVMEEECFENEEIATFLNRNFIAVKVDREERPDVDSVYMTALHAMGAQGGWPLNVFVTPQRQPFYGGTYFPPLDHSRGIGFLSLLKRLAEAYRGAPERVAQAGGQVTEAVRDMLERGERGEVTAREPIRRALEVYRDRFDPVHGGLLGAPKFPSSLPVRLLFRSRGGAGERDDGAMARLTLQRMAQAGIQDQIGGGFHRYATDQSWMIPHFEKMLYDNAILAVAYLEGYQVTGDPDLAGVARGILRYLQRDMAAPQGGFYAATDADSLAPNGRREEGYFFTWTPDEVSEVLGPERAEVAAAAFGIDRSGNFEGRSIPHRNKSVTELAEKYRLGEEEVAALLEEARELLYRARRRRPLPLRDEKILAAWNGLAISAFARASAVLGAESFLGEGERAANFLLENLVSDGRLAHSYQEGKAKGEGFLEDYAFLIAALLDLFEASGRARWLEEALRLARIVQEEFQDHVKGGYYMTGPRHEELIAREKPAYDGVVPSGNSAMVMNLLKLHLFTEDEAFSESARRAIAACSSQLATAPTALSDLLLALDFQHDTPKQIAIVAPRGRREAALPFLEQLAKLFVPNRVFACVAEGEELERAAALVPFLRGKVAKGDQAVAYLCENRSCRLPTSDPEEFRRQLAAL